MNVARSQTVFVARFSKGCENLTQPIKWDDTGRHVTFEQVNSILQLAHRSLNPGGVGMSPAKPASVRTHTWIILLAARPSGTLNSLPCVWRYTRQAKMEFRSSSGTVL